MAMENYGKVGDVSVVNMIWSNRVIENWVGHLLAQRFCSLWLCSHFEDTSPSAVFTLHFTRLPPSSAPKFIL